MLRDAVPATGVGTFGYRSVVQRQCGGNLSVAVREIYAFPQSPGVGGWKVSAILTYAGGYPIGVNDSQENPLLVNGFNRANIARGASLKTFDYKRSVDYFTGKTAVQPVQFTTNAFSDAGAWVVGNSLRSYSQLRTPPLRIENFAGFKTFAIGERVKATLRVDYFNAFNRTQLNGPDTEVEDSTFGQIINLGSQISNRQGQASFRIEF